MQKHDSILGQYYSDAPSEPVTTSSSRMAEQAGAGAGSSPGLTKADVKDAIALQRSKTLTKQQPVADKGVPKRQPSPTTRPQAAPRGTTSPPMRMLSPVPNASPRGSPEMRAISPGPSILARSLSSSRSPFVPTSPSSTSQPPRVVFAGPATTFTTASGEVLGSPISDKQQSSYGRLADDEEGLAGPDNDRMRPAGGEAATDFWKRFSAVVHDAETKPKQASATSRWLSEEFRSSRTAKISLTVLALVILAAIGGGLGYHFTHIDKNDASQPSLQNFGVTASVPVTSGASVRRIPVAVSVGGVGAGRPTEQATTTSAKLVPALTSASPTSLRVIPFTSTTPVATATTAKGAAVVATDDDGDDDLPVAKAGAGTAGTAKTPAKAVQPAVVAGDDDTVAVAGTVRGTIGGTAEGLTAADDTARMRRHRRGAAQLDQQH